MNAMTVSSSWLESGRNELKYTFSLFRKEAIHTWLKSRFALDDQYPSGEIHTIYFDSLEKTFLNEKVNSDYLKTKARVRWYSGIGDSQENLCSPFIEVKKRVGRKTMKWRQQLDGGFGDIHHKPLNDSVFIQISAMLKQHFQIFAGRPIFPMFYLSYNRYRFKDSLHKLRLSLDSNIRVHKINPLFFYRFNPFVLNKGVFEIKGSFPALPDHMQFILQGGCVKESFSKFLACYNKILNN